jgi:hypothetical protein
VSRPGDPVPGSAGTFVAFPSDPRLNPAGGLVCAVAWPTDPCSRVADLGSAIPGGAGNFTGFDGVAIAVFRGLGSNGQDGIYVHEHPTPCFVVGDVGTVVPGSNATFVSFDGVAAGGEHAVSNARDRGPTWRAAAPDAVGARCGGRSTGCASRSSAS